MTEFVHQGTAMVALTRDDAAGLIRTFDEMVSLSGQLCDDPEVSGSGALIDSFWETTSQHGEAFPDLPEMYRTQGGIAIPTAVYNGTIIFIEAIQAAQTGSCTPTTVEQAHNAALMASSEAPAQQTGTAPEPHPWTKVGIAVGAIGVAIGVITLVHRW
jgi:hypothetical protein